MHNAPPSPVALPPVIRMQAGHCAAHRVVVEAGEPRRAAGQRVSARAGAPPKGLCLSASVHLTRLERLGCDERNGAQLPYLLGGGEEEGVGRGRTDT